MNLLLLKENDLWEDRINQLESYVLFISLCICTLLSVKEVEETGPFLNPLENNQFLDWIACLMRWTSCPKQKCIPSRRAVLPSKRLLLSALPEICILVSGIRSWIAVFSWYLCSYTSTHTKNLASFIEKLTLFCLLLSQYIMKCVIIFTWKRAGL